jgi:hypothetical protein
MQAAQAIPDVTLIENKMLDHQKDSGIYDDKFSLNVLSCAKNQIG